MTNNQPMRQLAQELLDALIQVTMEYKTAYRLETGKDLPREDLGLTMAYTAIEKADDAGLIV